MKKIILLFLILNTTFVVSQQKNEIVSTFKNTINESIYLHVSSTTALVGETLFYKAYCLNSFTQKISPLSKIIYVEIIDSEKNSVVKQKLHLKDGVAQGDVFIPTTISSGSYKLISYTNWMTNSTNSNYYSTDLSVINPYQSNIKIHEANSIIEAKNNKSIIELEKKEFTSREKVNLKINTLSKKIEKGNYSISVRKINKNIDSKQLTSDDFINTINKKTADIINTTDEILPEIRGEVISGKITSIDNLSSINKKAIALSIPGKSFCFKIVNTNSKGEFLFILDEYPLNSKVVVQVMENNRKDYKIMLNEKKIDFSNLEFLETKSISNEQKKDIEKRSIGNQIENAYFSIKKDTIKENPTNKPFYHTLEQNLNLDEYTRFSSLKETIIEILPNIYFREKDGDYSINMRDKLTNGFDSGFALVLVDGLLIQNTKEIFDYNTKNIDKVNYITENYVYGPRVFNGVLSFISKEFNYELKEEGDYIIKTELQRPLNKKYYYNQDYSDISKYERIPDYRQQLLWIPDADLNKTISFYTSDNTGQFEINIEGFTFDGKPISEKEYFEVK